MTAEPGAALLGAFTHHLLWHATSDGSELDLMQRAADLWSRGSTLLSQMGALRQDLENALQNPADPGSVDKFNAAAFNAQVFSNAAVAMQTDINALRAAVMKFPHLPPHPRQRDLATNAWDWGNLTLGRRTDALVRSLSRLASQPSTVAFATGAAASYGANVAGSAYLGHVVGGSRRSHRHRDRLARNAVGGWLAAHHPSAVPPSAMAALITFGPAGNPTLPPELETLVREALTKTFDIGQTQPLPDLKLGYTRLVAHLRLLDAFPRPQAPTPPGQFWMQQIYDDLQNPPTSLRPQDVDVTGKDGGGVQVQYGPPEPGSSTPSKSDSSKVGAGCGIALLLIILVDLIQAFVQCIGQWANHHRCTFWKNMLLSKLFEQDPPDPSSQNGPSNTSVTAQQLTAIASGPDAASLVGQLSDANAFAWEVMDNAYIFLAGAGLIYPGHLLGMPKFSQFTSVPAGQPWPRREEADAVETFHFYPVSSVENPTVAPSPFPVGAAPDVSLSSNALNGSAVALSLWRQIAATEQDSQNRDLDADRGFLHPCWAAKRSVGDDPIDVLVLAFDAQ
jgi:hypothetical protein